MKNTPVLMARSQAAENNIPSLMTASHIICSVLHFRVGSLGFTRAFAAPLFCEFRLLESWGALSPY